VDENTRERGEAQDQESIVSDATNAPNS
jgi:hypothetical protein